MRAWGTYRRAPQSIATLAPGDTRAKLTVLTHSFGQGAAPDMGLLMDKAILIFPAGMPDSLNYLKQCLRRKRRVVGASSLCYDPSRGEYTLWSRLPYITEPEFNESLIELVRRFDIGEIYSPNAVIWEHLRRTLADIFPGVTLANASPFGEALNSYRSALWQARAISSQPIPIASSHLPRPSVSEIELAALSRHANTIPGMCDNDKLHALCEILRYSPPGDIVEIGSWWGKSAFILGRLAISYGLGNLLCVDPWTNAHLVQNEPLVDRCSAQMDAEEAFTIFEMNLLPYNANHINYLRTPSVEGAELYGSGNPVSSPSFGRTSYCGEIAVLHIDGNHRYEAVSADVNAWSAFVSDGGWIVIDDYLWPYGDGPQRAGNELLESNKLRIELAFVQGSALFIKTNSSP